MSQNERRQTLVEERAELVKALADETARLETAKEGLRAAQAKKHLTGRFVHPTEFRRLQQARERSISEISSIQADLADLNAELRSLNADQEHSLSDLLKAILSEVRDLKNLASIKADKGASLDPGVSGDSDDGETRTA